ncbi:deoxyribonuclease-1-like 1 [Gymnodraco acuticeps]|uniref:Deoxyribonuclease n=1 Tax=Gymnodraco acuticeps TaxID=8218 RepID=A0A6P8TE49_GYMAC|nr:deoxyribonuclease-1-like 1 [Gymnodraco acuticeps]
MKIAAFNVKRLGWTKVNKKAVREIIIEIVSEYSVVVLLEVMDESGKAMKLLLKHLNDYGDNKRNPYGMLCSEPLGPEGRQEKFVYFYRKKEVQILDSYQYGENNEDDVDDEDDEDDDEDEEDVDDVDELAREPFAVLLKCPNTVVQNLVLIPVHTTPSDAEAELNALHDVVEDVRERWQNDNIMILGDFNADGQYLSMRKKDSILISSAPYYWLIDDDVDTTTSNNNDHTYDRIVVYGKRMLKAIVPNSAIAYNFEEDLNLTEEETQSVSDHYPVEVELKQKAQRKRNPGTTGGAQKKKAGPAAKKRRGA